MISFHLAAKAPFPVLIMSTHRYFTVTRFCRL